MWYQQSTKTFHVATNSQVADIFTKALGISSFTKLSGRLGLKDIFNPKQLNVDSSVQVSELEDASTVTKRQQNKKKATPRCLGEINKEAKKTATSCLMKKQGKHMRSCKLKRDTCKARCHDLVGQTQKPLYSESCQKLVRVGFYFPAFSIPLSLYINRAVTILESSSFSFLEPSFLTNCVSCNRKIFTVINGEKFTLHCRTRCPYCFCINP